MCDSEKQSYVDEEGVPTEKSVLRKFWIDNRSRAVLYRVIRYEFEDQEDLDRQMSRSLSEGIHRLGGGNFAVKDFNDCPCPEEILDQLDEVTVFSHKDGSCRRATEEL